MARTDEDGINELQDLVSKLNTILHDLSLKSIEVELNQLSFPIMGRQVKESFITYKAVKVLSASEYVRPSGGFS